MPQSKKDEAYVRAQRLHSELEAAVEHEFLTLLDWNAKACVRWPEYLVCSAELGEPWSMMKLAAWHISRGERDVSLVWLECVIQIYTDTRTTAGGPYLRSSVNIPSTDKNSRGYRIGHVKLFRVLGLIMDAFSAKRFSTFLENGQMVSPGLNSIVHHCVKCVDDDVHHWANRALMSFGAFDIALAYRTQALNIAARGLWGGILSVSGVLQVIRRLLIDALPVVGAQSFAIDEFKKSRQHFSDEVRRATLVYWTISLAANNRTVKTYCAPSPPNHVLDAVHTLAIASLLDEEMFQLAIKVLRQWAKSLELAPVSAQSNFRAPVAAKSNFGAKTRDWGEFRDDIPRTLWFSEHWQVLYKPAMWAVSWTAPITSDFTKLERDWVGACGTRAQLRGGGEVPLDRDLEPFGPGDHMVKSCDLLHWLLRSSASLLPVTPGIPTIQTDRCLSYGLSHRLDAQTSGPLVVARSYWGWAWIQLQFRAKRVTKRYVCLCHGHVELSPGKLISWPLVRQSIPGRISMRSVVCSSGMCAVTEVVAVAHLWGPPCTLPKLMKSTYLDCSYSLVDIRLWTGRLHQIRVHMAAEGHPLVSDAIYSGGRAFWCPRFFLHCYSLGVPYDMNTDHVNITCQLPWDLRQVLRRMEACDHKSHNFLVKWLGCVHEHCVHPEPVTTGSRLSDGRWYGRVIQAVSNLQKRPGLVRFKSNDRLYTVQISADNFKATSHTPGSIVYFQVVERQTGVYAIDLQDVCMRSQATL